MAKRREDLPEFVKRRMELQAKGYDAYLKKFLEDTPNKEKLAKYPSSSNKLKVDDITDKPDPKEPRGEVYTWILQGAEEKKKDE